MKQGICEKCCRKTDVNVFKSVNIADEGEVELTLCFICCVNLLKLLELWKDFDVVEEGRHWLRFDP